ncbi:MAG: hypothetical protein JW940_27520 [Polyangiaceae bacterium]|nr:hypothetical protein [Polyangiaceae bacterium]
MVDSVLTEPERRFLAELHARGVEYMIVGLTAASLHGADTTTVDVDLWFATTADPRIGEAANAAGGIWVSGFGMMPASLGGALERFDVVLHMSGLEGFAAEFERSKSTTIEGVSVRILALDRILASKRAANRVKDRAVIPALEEALAAITEADD